MSEWKEYKLGEIIDVRDGTHDSPKQKHIGKPLVTSKHIKGGKIDLSTAYLISIDDFEKINKRSKVDKWDVLFSMIGTIGEMVVIKEEPDFAIKNVGLFKAKDEYTSKWIYYYLKSPKAQSEILSSLKGSTQQYISLTDLRNFPITYPPIKEGWEIVQLLSSLDGKIELNNKINQELENLAQTLFKQWFIDFEFPDENGEPYKSSGGEMVDSELGEIPKGWVLDSLDKIADFLNGLALQKFPAASDFDFLPVIKIRELRQKDTTNSDKASSAIPAKYIIHNGDVLFSWSGTLMVDFWTNGKGALNQHLFKVTSNQFPKWFYYLWTKHHLSEFIKIAESKATTMGHIQRQHLSDAKVVIPNEINNFSVIIEPFITKIINNRIESFELIQLRDSLLPKLISGELEVKQTIN